MQRISILSHPTLPVRLFFLYLLLPPPQSRAGVVVSSALSKHPSSGSSGFQRILQTSPFIYFPLRTKRRQPRAGPTSAGTPVLLPDLLRHYPVFRGEVPLFLLPLFLLAPFPHCRTLTDSYEVCEQTRSIVSRDRSRSIRERR